MRPRADFPSHRDEKDSDDDALAAKSADRPAFAVRDVAGSAILGPIDVALGSIDVTSAQ